MQVYHGTRSYFTEIDFSKLGANRGAEYGAGFYLTTDEDYAAGYAEDATKGMVVTGDIDSNRLFTCDEQTVDQGVVEKIKQAFKEIFPVEGTSNSFNQGNFLVAPTTDGMTNKQLFNIVGMAVEKVTSSDGDNPHVDWAKNLSKVIASAGFIGVHDIRDATIVVFKSADLPELTLHKTSMFGRPDGMPENINIGDVVIPKPAKLENLPQPNIAFES